MRAYVVDDQRAIVEMMMMLFNEIGVDASGTTNARLAHDAIAHTQPDLVVLDIMMPGLDGLALLDGLQRDERTVHIPIVLCTASILDSTQGRSLADRGIGVLAKPFDIEQLEDVVEAIRGRRREE